MLDTSGSTTSSNFALVKSFLSQIVGRLDVDGGMTRVGVVTFSSGVGSGFYLNTYSSAASLQSAIAALAYTGGGTDVASAFSFVRSSMLNPAAGDRFNVPNFVVVLTYGQSSSMSATQVGTVLSQKPTQDFGNGYNLNSIYGYIAYSKVHFSFLILDIPRLLASVLASYSRTFFLKALLNYLL